MSEETKNAQAEKLTISPEDIHMPPNSFWPIVLALGFVIILGGLALSWPLAIIGVLMVFVSAIGWVIEPV